MPCPATTRHAALAMSIHSLDENSCALFRLASQPTVLAGSQLAPASPALAGRRGKRPLTMAEEDVDNHVLRKYSLVQKLGKGVSGCGAARPAGAACSMPAAAAAAAAAGGRQLPRHGRLAAAAAEPAAEPAPPPPLL